MNKTIKKIVALSMGATMLAGTAAMALAADLSDYPSPFVKDSVFVGKIVIGEKAAAIDVLGATDIAASLQREAAVGVGGTSSSKATATSGYHFEENDVLVLGKTLSSVGKTTVDDTDLPELLASGIIENDDSEFDYDLELNFAGSVGVVAADVTNDLQDLGYTKPMVYFNLDEGNGQAYKTIIDFQDSWSASDFTNSETIELFGTEYTFNPKNTNTNDVLTLYGSDTTLLIAKGGSETVTYNGKEYTIEVLGGNSDDASAILRINGDTRTVKEGDSKTMPAGGLPIYVKNVFVSNIGGDDVSAQLFIGSNKLELDSDGTVTKNGVELDEVSLTVGQVTSNATHPWYKVNKLTFTVTPPAADEEVNFILPGEAYVDPLFGAFKLNFVGSKDLEAGKEQIKFTRSGSNFGMAFTPRGGSKTVELKLLKNAGLESNMWEKINLTDLAKNEIFFYNDGSSDDKKETHVLQIDSISKGNESSNTNFEVVIDDLSTGKTYTIDDATTPVSSDITLYAVNGSDKEHITLSAAIGGAARATDLELFTKAGAKIAIQNIGYENFTISEDADGDNETAAARASIVIGADYVTDEWDTKVRSGLPTALQDDVDDTSYYLTEFGTYVVADTSDGGNGITLYVPAKEVSYDMFLTPINAEIVVTSSSSGGAVALNPISVGMAILDSEANVGSKAYIVVGGPCANTAAAELMGNPADCAAGFTEGKAMIKLYSAKNALLVAGYAGKDTQGACRVLANYEDYGFTGSELEVTTANLNSLSVKKLS